MITEKSKEFFKCCHFALKLVFSTLEVVVSGLELRKEYFSANPTKYGEDMSKIFPRKFSISLLRPLEKRSEIKRHPEF